MVFAIFDKRISLETHRKIINKLIKYKNLIKLTQEMKEEVLLRPKNFS